MERISNNLAVHQWITSSLNYDTAIQWNTVLPFLPPLNKMNWIYVRWYKKGFKKYHKEVNNMHDWIWIKILKTYIYIHVCIHTCTYLRLHRYMHTHTYTLVLPDPSEEWPSMAAIALWNAFLNILRLKSQNHFLTHGLQTGIMLAGMKTLILWGVFIRALG